jgi:SWI/SNF-related matrix-associated actin-dependent regulator 1 of chromatin subfamily A
MTGLSDKDLHELCQQYPTLRPHALPRDLVVSGSSKLVRLRKMLPELAADGHRMLVFSQWTTMLDLLEELCEELLMDYRRLDGSTVRALTPVPMRRSTIVLGNHRI